MEPEAKEQQAAEVAEAPAPVQAAPVEAPPQEARKPEKTEEAAKVEKKEEKPEKSLEFFIKRIGQLETEKKELNAVISGMKEAEELKAAELAKEAAKRKAAARSALLEGEYKILKPEYMALAPSMEEADPTSEEGKEAIRQWVNSNPGLFGKAPDLPVSDKTPEKRSPFAKKGWTWADKWRDQK